MAEGDVQRLLELYRRGELSRERLRVAAFVGDEDAGRALERLGDARAGERLSLPPQLIGVIGWHPQAAVRTSVAAARWALARWTHSDPTPWEAVEAAEAWILAPGAETRSAAGEAGVRIDDLRRRLQKEGPSPWIALAAGEAARTAYCSAPEWRAGAALGAVRGALRAEDAALALGESPADRGLDRAIADELVPWALGRSDPVRDRAES